MSTSNTKPPLNPPLRRSKRTKTQPSWLADYVSSLANSTTNCEHPEFQCFMVHIHQAPDPLTFFEASKHPHWVIAMNEELSTSKQNNTWVVTDLPLAKRQLVVSSCLKLSIFLMGA